MKYPWDVGHVRVVGILEIITRWAGRNAPKDELRNSIWQMLEETGVAVGPAVSHIPNYVGADMAAWRLAQAPAWQAARNVKCNPDPAQYQLRLRALYDGKVLFCPVPELASLQLGKTLSCTLASWPTFCAVSVYWPPALTGMRIQSVSLASQKANVCAEVLIARSEATPQISLGSSARVQSACSELAFSL